ncbi:unnamed protein product, partial [Nesidiocoris tenuis]
MREIGTIYYVAGAIPTMVGLVMVACSLLAVMSSAASDRLLGGGEREALEGSLLKLLGLPRRPPLLGIERIQGAYPSGDDIPVRTADGPVVGYRRSPTAGSVRPVGKHRSELQTFRVSNCFLGIPSGVLFMWLGSDDNWVSFGEIPYRVFNFPSLPEDNVYVCEFA